MKRIGKLLLGLTLYSVVSLRCEATVYNSNGSVESVQALHDIAVNGDTITLPAGTFVWAQRLRIGKNITIRGAGPNVTIVRANLSTPIVALNRFASRVTGIHFKQQGGGTIINTDGQNFRVDNNILENASARFTKSAVLAQGSSTVPHPTGVIDHNTVIDAKVMVQGDISLWAHQLWNEPSKIGNPDQTGVVYLEDNIFNRTTASASDAIDGDYGARYVARHNTFRNCHIEIHPTRGSGRGAKSWEVYDNVFIRTAPGDDFTAIWQRGATGVIYNNTVTGLWEKAVVMDNWRSFKPSGYPPGNCNGSSNWDTNGGNGWPCRDQIGRGPDSYLFSSPPYPPQALEPTYIWNNRINNAPAVPFVSNCSGGIKPNGSCVDIQQGRDYHLGQRPNYAPYAYPHPLTRGRGRAVVADFNGDNTPDIVVQSSNTYETVIGYLDDNVYIGAAWAPTLLRTWILTGVADFNQDSHPDYLLCNAGTDRTAILYLSGSNLVGAAFGPTLPHGWEVAAAADFNGDSYTDYVLYKTRTGETAIAYLHNNNLVGGGFGPTVSASWSLIGAADFDHDNHPDYLLFNLMTGETAIWYLSDRSLLRTEVGPAVPAGWALVATADFNGDGNPDYLLYEPHGRRTGIWYLDNNIYLNSASGPTLPPGWTLVNPLSD